MMVNRGSKSTARQYAIRRSVYFLIKGSNVIILNSLIGYFAFTSRSSYGDYYVMKIMMFMYTKEGVSFNQTKG